MSRRGRRREPERDAPASSAPPGPAERRGGGLAAQIGILLGVFALATLIAELAGAANLGVALGVGQIAFALALVALMIWR